MDELSTLVEAARRGDQEAFGALVARFQAMAHAVAYGMIGDAQLAEDAAQEAFVEAYFSLPRLREPAAFPGWFRRIVVKQGDRCSRTRRAALMPLEAAADFPAGDPSPAAALEARDLQVQVRRALAALPEHERIVTVLYYLAGYPQADIATFLEVPVTTVKKRLYDARRRLKAHLPADLDDARPRRLAEDSRFTRRVQLLIALRTGHLPRVAALLASDSALVNIHETREDFDALGGGRYYLPVGSGYTPLHRAAANGDLPLLRLLLSHGADPAACDNNGATPLHQAALHKHAAAVALLLAHGAAIDAPTQRGLTALHQAALRGNRAIVALLCARGADSAARDWAGRTPEDWAAIQHDDATAALLKRAGADPAACENTRDTQHATGFTPRRSVMKASTGTFPVGAHLLGRVINAAGEPLDGGGAILGAPRVTLTWPLPAGPAPAPSEEVWETGLKALDLLAPAARGGVLELVAEAGVGKLVLMGELIHNLAARRGGVAVCAGLEEQTFAANDFLRSMAELGVDAHTAVVFWQRDELPTARPRVLLAALALAAAFQREGREVLLCLDKKLGVTGELLGAAERLSAAGPAAITTVLFHPADDRPGAPDWAAPARPADAQVVLDRALANEGLFPAVDRLESHSRLLAPAMVGAEHVEVARRVREMLRRAAALTAQPPESRAAGDQQTLARAQRVQLFLTQPLFVAAAFTGRPGAYVPMADTVRDFGALLTGAGDDLPEEAFRWTGTLAQARANARDMAVK